MRNKLKSLFEERKEIIEDQKEIEKDNQEIKEKNKKFNKIVLKVFLASCGLMLPLALYITPIIPTTTTIAGATTTGLTPILPKAIPLDLIMYPAFLGMMGFASSTISYVVGNVLYFMPIKIYGKSLENGIEEEKCDINKRIITESNKKTSTPTYTPKPTYKQPASRTSSASSNKPVKNKYSYNPNKPRTTTPTRTTTNNNSNSRLTAEEMLKMQERIKKRQLKKNKAY